MILLIDGDILLYKAFYIYQAIRKESGKTGVSGTLLDKCLRQVLDTYYNKYSPSKVVIMCKLEEGRYFRHDIREDYKANRKPTPKEIIVLREKMKNIEDIELYSSIRIEIDDLLSLYISEHDKEELICLSGDKDLLQIPGRHASFYNDKIIEVETDEGEFHMEDNKLKATGFCQFLRQMIQGDKIDNIDSGFYRAGDSFTRKMLNELTQSYYPLDQLNELKIKYHNVELFYQNLQLVWMLRYSKDIKSSLVNKTMYDLSVLELQNEIWDNKLTYRDFLSYERTI